jgi:hypothetical protein
VVRPFQLKEMQEGQVLPVAPFRLWQAAVEEVQALLGQTAQAAQEALAVVGSQTPLLARLLLTLVEAVVRVALWVLAAPVVAALLSMAPERQAQPIRAAVAALDVTVMVVPVAQESSLLGTRSN